MKAYTTACSQQGTMCALHGRMVMAASPREAAAKVWRIEEYGPLRLQSGGWWAAYARPRAAGYAPPAGTWAHGSPIVYKGHSKHVPHLTRRRAR